MRDWVKPVSHPCFRARAFARARFFIGRWLGRWLCFFEKSVQDAIIKKLSPRRGPLCIIKNKE